MYINGLGMRDEANLQQALGVDAVQGVSSGADAVRRASSSSDVSFPTALKSAVESRSAVYDKLFGTDTEESAAVGEALERLEADPQWKDVGAALTALYENQQKMQTQMSLLSSGYYGGLSGTSALSAYGFGVSPLSAYTGGGLAGSLLGSSIFGDISL